MPVTIVAGVQWGDEGKGKIVDMLAPGVDIVARCQGGPNAGHTVVNDIGRFVLHTIPSGIFSESTRCIVGAGVVFSPQGLVEEMRALMDAGADVSRLLISERAHMIMPYHVLLERLDEENRSEESKVAPTGQGIGPAYADKAARRGIRAGDLLDASVLKRRVAEELAQKNRILEVYRQPTLTECEVLSALLPAAEFLRSYIGDTCAPIYESLSAGGRVLLEGQLGVMRDLDWGAYPFVTSSSPIPAGMAAGAGIPIYEVDRIIGVVRAYTTAVGAGPFPTELSGPEGDYLRDHGDEYGATTGRPRRCGWFDAVAAAWAVKLAGFTELALTKIDVLDGLAEIPVCTAYTSGGQAINGLPTTALMTDCVPVYRATSGWTGPTKGVGSMSDLPREAVSYIDEIERRCGAPITFVSVGPERDAVIRR